MPDPLLAGLRRDYPHAGLDEGDLAATWHEQLARWLVEAVAHPVAEANAAVLATATPDGRPSARTVLVKDLDARGLVVYTNLTSRKGVELAANPRAALVLGWLPLGRQVRVEAAVEAVAPEEAGSYFASRPRGAQVGAWASRQSSVLSGRAELEARQQAAEARFAGGPVPLPPFWGGLRLVPDSVEFWQGRADRLHDRLRFRRDGADAWVTERLSP